MDTYVKNPDGTVSKTSVLSAQEIDNKIDALKYEINALNNQLSGQTTAVADLQANINKKTQEIADLQTVKAAAPKP